MPKISGSQFVADSLEAYGVTHVFFVPVIMSHTLAQIEHRTGIQRIMTHAEKSAVYMADGYARASGRPGISFAQCIGAANLAAALRDPFMACSPMVVFTGGPYPYTRHRHAYQEIDDFSMFKPVTKYSARVDRVSRLPDVLRQAFRSATTGTPGPAHIEVEGHMGELEEQVDELLLVPEPQFGQVPGLRSLADPDAVAQAARLWERANRPVIVAGGGVRSSAAGAELIELAERLAIPVATSMNAKDVMPGNHRLNVSVPGTYSRKSANQVVLEADLVFFVGSHSGSQVTGKWRVPRPGTPVIQLDIDPEELGRHYPNQVSLLGDVKATLAQLIEAADASTATNRAAWLDRTAALGAKLALPDRPVLLFSGDGGFWYHLAELETAARYGINAVLLSNNNQSLNQTVPCYKDAYGGQLSGRHGKLWKFMEVNFTDIARTMGVEGIRVQKPVELAGALDKAFSSNKPFVVEVMTDMSAMAPLAFLG